MGEASDSFPSNLLSTYYGTHTCVDGANIEPNLTPPELVPFLFISLSEPMPRCSPAMGSTLLSLSQMCLHFNMDSKEKHMADQRAWVEALSLLGPLHITLCWCIPLTIPCPVLLWGSQGCSMG